MTYERGVGEVQVTMRSTGPDVEVTYVQSIPLGARNIRMEGTLGGGRGRQDRSRHDELHELTFRMTEQRSVRLRFQWEGGLEVFPVLDRSLSPSGSGSSALSNSGVRILDFSLDGEEWILVLEGQGGTRGMVALRGEPVDAGGEGVSVEVQDTEGALLIVEFPPEGTRVVKTIRLNPIGPG
jgi:hypothetical protein